MSAPQMVASITHILQDGRKAGRYVAVNIQPYDANLCKRSTIADFLNLLTEVFAREPPVMSRQQQPPVQAYQQLPPRPPPLSESRPPSGAYQSATTGAPPPPPKPTDQSNGSRSPFLQREPLRQGRYDAPPPLPGQAPSPRPASMSLPLSQGYPPHIQYQPQRQSSLRQGYPTEQQPPSNMQNQPQRQPTLGSPSPNQSRIQPVARRAPPPTIQSLYQQTQPQYFAQPPPQHQYPLQDMQPNRQIQQASYQQQAQLPKPKPQEPNLMDASPFDVTLPRANTAHLPTPVIPPNPEKQHILQSLQSALLSNLQSQISQSTSAVAPLQSQYSALQAAQQNLQQELNQLQTLQSQLQQNISSLTSTISSADRTIGSARNESSPSKIPNIDELIIAPTVVARQLYDNVAEQRGYEAAIYALTEGFVRGRIGGELWARKTRECAREEFRRKWLVRRIGRGMALDMSQMEG